MTCIALLIPTFDVRRPCEFDALASDPYLELRSTCELTRLAQRGRRATAMAAGYASHAKIHDHGAAR